MHNTDSTYSILFRLDTGLPLDDSDYADRAVRTSVASAHDVWLSDLGSLHPIIRQHSHRAPRIPQQRVDKLELAGFFTIGDACGNEDAALALHGIGHGTVIALRQAWWGLYRCVLADRWGLTHDAELAGTIALTGAAEDHEDVDEPAHDRQGPTR